MRIFQSQVLLAWQHAISSVLHEIYYRAVTSVGMPEGLNT